MAAKKKTAKKSASKSTGAEFPKGSVMLALDPEQLLALKIAIETLSEFASALMTASDDPIVKGNGGKTAKKSAKKSAKKGSKKRG